MLPMELWTLWKSINIKSIKKHIMDKKCGLIFYLIHEDMFLSYETKCLNSRHFKAVCNYDMYVKNFII